MRSILAQTHRDLELIVINDGSTDHSSSIADDLASADPRVKVIHQKNMGVISALNVGIAEARGKYIARMDADDISLDRRFEAQVEVLEKHPEIIILGCKSRTIGADDQDTGHETSVPRSNSENFKIIHGSSTVKSFPPSILQVLHPTIMMRTSDIKALGGYSTAFEHVEDYDLYLRAARIGMIATIDELLFLYRLHGNNISINKLDEQEKNAALCDLLRVQEYRRSCADADLKISKMTLSGWAQFRIARRKSRLSTKYLRNLLEAFFLTMRGSFKTSPSITIKISARCLYYFFRFFLDKTVSHGA
jgi:glycosyltransferase involved in cell wall biosynthesis